MKKILLGVRHSWVLLIAWFVFASPFIIKGTIPFPTQYLVTTFAPWSTSYAMPVKSGSMPDVITQIYPWKKITIDSWKRGSIPLWNPYSFAGTMHAGNYQTAIFSPINLLYFIFSMPTAWSLAVLFQPLLAGLCMYLFLKSERVSNIAATIGSLAFMFCGFMVVWMAYETLGFAILPLPLCLWAINAWREKKQRWALGLLSVGIAWSLVSGHFQISVYCIGTALIYSIWGAYKARSWKALYPCVFILLGMVVAAPQLWETFRAYAQSVRSSSFAKGEIIPWQYLITFFAPDFYGHPVTRNDWYGHYAEWAGFIGIVPLVLALSAGFISKHRQVFFFGALAIITILFALPTPLTDLLYAAKIPVLSTSSASRIIVITSFSLAVLCAVGFDAVMVLWQKKDIQRILGIVSAWIIFLLIFWIVLKGFHPLAPDKLSIAIRNALLPSAILVSTLGILVLGVYLPKKYLLVCVYGLVLLTAVDLLRFSMKWMPFEPRSFLYPSMPITREIERLQDIGTSRVIGNFGNELSGMIGMQGLEGYDAVYKRRYGEFMTALTDTTIGQPGRSVVLLDKHGLNTEKAIQLMGVGYYVHKVSDGRFPWAYPFWEHPNYDVIWRDQTYELFRNATPFPRAYLTSSYIVVTDNQKILNTLFSDAFDRRNTLILEQEPLLHPASGSGEVTIAVYEPEKIVMQVKTTVPKLLFVSDVYDSGWNAYINGKKTPIYRADYTFRAIGVPAGESTVMMVYEPVSIRYGLVLSFLAIGSIVGLSFKKRI